MKSLFSLSFWLCCTAIAGAPDYSAAEKSYRELIGAMIAADTTNPPGNEARIVKILAERFKKEGVSFEITEFAPNRQNIVARLKGDGSLRPVMIIAHTDVVGTKDQVWSIPNPHQMTEKDGFLYGRGVSDDLSMVAAAVETLILVKNSGMKLKRDLIIALTGDEESDGLGIQYLLKNHPEQVNAEIAFNEGGGFILNDNGDKAGGMKLVNLQFGEKIYEDFLVTAEGTTGHSSTPQKDNAIYKLSKALARLDGFKFPIRMIPGFRRYLKERAPLESEPLSSAMKQLAASGPVLPKKALKTIEESLIFSTMLRTTCVATLIEGGTKRNALPPKATANINCRILPDESPKDVRLTLAKVMNDPSIKIEAVENSEGSPASPLEGPGMVALETVIHEMYPKLPIIPTIARGATDSRFLRAHGIAAYGINPIAGSENDSRRAHGIDERIPVSSIKPGIEFMYRLVENLAGKNTAKSE